jgi:D,D-heptose 1,7-bisphosphate phosphatase
MKKAILIDKDGTLIQDVPYNTDLARVVLAPGVVKGLRLFRQAGFALAVITNQSGIARGYFKEADFDVLMRGICAMLPVQLDGWYYCPHHPEGSVAAYAVHCDCRKPKPGLILEAADKLGIDLSVSWMIGDILDDVEAGNRAGCGSVLIDNGNETEWRLTPLRRPIFYAEDLEEAANRIIHHSYIKT